MTNIADIALSEGLNAAISQIDDHKILVTLACDFAERVVHFASHPSAKAAIMAARGIVACTSGPQELRNAAAAIRDYATCADTAAAANATHTAAAAIISAIAFSDGSSATIIAAINAAANAADTKTAEVYATTLDAGKASAAYDAEREWQIQHLIKKVFQQ